jgi:hypothetical protein
MTTKFPGRIIFDVLMAAIEDDTMPRGDYGPATYRRASPEEIKRYGLKNDIQPVAHLDARGVVDCFIT